MQQEKTNLEKKQSKKTPKKTKPVIVSQQVKNQAERSTFSVARLSNEFPQQCR